MRNFAIIQLNDGAVRGPAKNYVSPPPYIPLPPFVYQEPILTNRLFWEFTKGHLLDL